MMSPPLPLLRAEDVKARADFVVIASRYTHLRRAGRQFVGLCPFHKERHASFYVESEQKIWKCFGCDAGGDVFSFVMRAEGCDFLDALRIVASWDSQRQRASEASERFGAGERAKPLGLRSKPAVIVRPVESRAQILASLEATNRRLARIAATNRAALAALATACEPELEVEVVHGAGSFT